MAIKTGKVVGVGLDGWKGYRLSGTWVVLSVASNEQLNAGAEIIKNKREY